MGLLTRIFNRDKPPAEALTGLDRDERVTAWALTGAGPAVVATPRGLWLTPAPQPVTPTDVAQDESDDDEPAAAEAAEVAAPDETAAGAGAEPVVAEPDAAAPAPAETAVAETTPSAETAAPGEPEPAATPVEASTSVEPKRLPWNEIHKATWNGSLLTIVPAVEVEPGVVADGPPVRLRLAEPRGLAAEVRARVTRSVAHSVHRELPTGGVLIVARRVPGADGLTWLLRFDDGTDRADPDVRLRAAELLDEVQAAADVAH